MTRVERYCPECKRRICFDDFVETLRCPWCGFRMHPEHTLSKEQVAPMSEDPFADRLMSPPWRCIHGNGSNCECQLPVYRGLYVAAIKSKEDKLTRHIIAHTQQARDGGMVQFLDPTSGEIVGCMGIHVMYSQVRTAEEFIANVSLPHLS